LSLSSFSLTQAPERPSRRRRDGPSHRGKVFFSNLEASRDAMNRDLDFMGASLSSGAYRDYATLNLRVLKKDLDKALISSWKHLLSQPSQRRRFAGSLRRRWPPFSRQRMTWRGGRKRVPKGPFRNQPVCTPHRRNKESLQRITRDGILHFYRSYFHPNNAILVVVGDVTAEEVRTKVLPRFGSWPKERSPKNLSPSPSPKRRRR